MPSWTRKHRKPDLMPMKTQPTKPRPAGSTLPPPPAKRAEPKSESVPSAAATPSSGQRFQISDLCAILETYLEPRDVADVYRAYLFGAEAHDGQQRVSGEPYIYHPIEVARILAGMRLDAKSITAAILHDVIEDTPTAKEHIAEEFGEDIAALVDGVSKITRIEFQSQEEAQAENFRKMLLAMASDIRVILIKLADRLNNMRTISALPPPPTTRPPRPRGRAGAEGRSRVKRSIFTRRSPIAWVCTSGRSNSKIWRW